MNLSIEKKHKKLFFKARYLSAELEEMEEKFEECKILFLDEISKEDMDAARAKDPLKKCVAELDKDLDSIFDEKIIENIKNNLPPSFKKLYKKIMIKVHPDKMLFLNDDDQKNQYKTICTKANFAVNEGNWYMMVEAAMELGISIPDVSNEHIEWLRKDCDKLNEKIKDIKGTLPWVWFHSDGRVKNLCIKQYVDNVF